jgi:hypothetical protein
MAREVLALQATSRTGLDPAYTAATADGHAFDNTSEKVIIHVKNGGAGASVLTIDIPGTVDSQTVTDKTVSVPAGGERIIGPFPRAIYNQNNIPLSLNQAIHINTDVQTSVTYAAIKLGEASY